MRPLTGLCLAVLLASTSLTASAADSVVRKSAKAEGGKITGSTRTELQLKTGTGNDVTIPANDILSVSWDDATGELKLGLSDENAGRLDSALQRITKSQAESKTDSDILKAEFEFLIARVTARMALADPSKQDEAIKLLTAFTKSRSDHFRYYEAVALLGQVQLAKQDFDAARKAFDTLGEAPFSDLKLAAKIASGRILMGENKLDEAVGNFDEAAGAAGSTPAEQARRYEALLGKARALSSQGKQAEALAVVDEVTQKAPADDTAVQAEAYVLQGNALQALGRIKEAVLAYLHVDILFPRETAYHAESLYHLSRLWKQIQFPERGLDAQGKLQQSYANSDWAKKLSAAPGE
jgi:tetratricopeptide (TPR) repeat protein